MSDTIATRATRAEVLTIVDHLPAPLLESHLRLGWEFVQVWTCREDDDSVPASRDLYRFLLPYPLDGWSIFRIWPEDAERRSANITSDPSVVQPCLVSRYSCNP